MEKEAEVSRVVSRIIVATLSGVVALGGAATGASAMGLWSVTPTTIDSNTYVLPPPLPVSPTLGLSVVDPTIAADIDRIRRGLDALSQDSVGLVSYNVIDLSGNQLASQAQLVGRVPASSLKILTCLAILSSYGPSHRFTTTVVSSASGIVLVGGGDPYLTANQTYDTGVADAHDLADQVSQFLVQAGRKTVTLGYDDHLFAGSSWHHDWPASWAVDVAPISALSIDPNGNADSDTAQQAAMVFANLLGERGIKVTRLQSERAEPGVQVLGQVESLPLGQIVQLVLKRSDNFASEVLFRHISVAGGSDGSFAEGKNKLAAYLKSVGLWTDQMAVLDGSGLSMSDRVPAYVLSAAIHLAYEDTQLHDVLWGLPVAGVDGTLIRRFDDPDEAAGRGVVRAKTGTNDHVRTLTGFTQTSSGAIVIFSFILNDLYDYTAGVDWLDEAAAVLAS
jgi:D-alanyl-D-alanine carboxypeptidase/D-alanyl-D-alanine-endopeptidase (penicillin-binding protein 4)